LVLVLPLLWALAVEQPFYSLGPFEDNWQLGLGIATLGAVIVVVAFGLFFGILRTSAILLRSVLKCVLLLLLPSCSPCFFYESN
jgi:hypothetical protein